MARMPKRNPRRWSARPPGSISTAARPRSLPRRSASSAWIERDGGGGACPGPPPAFAREGSPMPDVSGPPAAHRNEAAPVSAASSDALPLLPHERSLAPGIDLAVAAAFFAFAVGIIGMGLSMPNYADQGGAMYQAPGFVPTFY